MTRKAAAAPLDAAGLAGLIDVSRETLAQFDMYLELLEQWQRAINLVGRSTLDDPWRRHILDCAQLARHLPKQSASVADLGSGAGLPGLVLAIMREMPVHLIESDKRKAQFLREAARRLALTHVTVHPMRIATVDIAVDVVTSRALAPLDHLLALAHPLLRPSGRLVLLKGRNVEAELTEARRNWTMRVAVEPSLADPDGCVLIVEEVCPLGH